MSRYRRADTPGATYFFTVVTYRRRPILCDAPVRAALRDAIKTVQSRHPFTIDAWVLLPDHLHTVWTLPPGDANYSLRWGLIKRMVFWHAANIIIGPIGCRRLKPNIVKQRFGNAVIGNIKSATKRILSGTSITFTTTRSNINIAKGWRIGRIQPFTDMLHKPGRVGSAFLPTRLIVNHPILYGVGWFIVIYPWLFCGQNSVAHPTFDGLCYTGCSVG